MNRISLFVIIIALVLFSCKGDDSVVQNHEYSDQSSGDLSLIPALAIVIQNQVGPVIIEGSSDTSDIRWYLNKWATSESQSCAKQIFSQIVVSLETRNDTAYVSVLWPSGITSCGSLLSLTVPDNIPCILRKVSGTSNVSYLRSSFVGENLTAATVTGHEGDCVLVGSSGDMSVEMALPDSGLCLVSCNSGNISLRIPAGTSSRLSAQTGNGSITYSQLVVGDSVRTQNSLTGKLGMGRGNIQLSTGRGSIVITGF